jgi:hypothetical protein
MGWSHEGAPGELCELQRLYAYAPLLFGPPRLRAVDLVDAHAVAYEVEDVFRLLPETEDRRQQQSCRKKVLFHDDAMYVVLSYRKFVRAKIVQGERKSK